MTESDESNNVGRAGAACQVRPPGPPFTLREKWAWTTANVLSTPAASDLDGDGVADVVFVAMGSGSATTDGRLRALRGRTGQVLFSVVDPTNDLNPSASPAIGDIDGDGRPEIVAVAEQGQQLLAFEHDGTFKWRSATLEFAVGAGAPFLADLDGDGRQEIVIGRQVLNGNGTLRWTGTGPMVGRSAVTGLRSVAADLDGDGIPEVIAGASAYRANGTLLWSVPAVGDGVVAVANLDSDPRPEIVVGNSWLWLLGHDGTLRWGPLTPPGNGNLSAVTIADFDGDAQPEIGVGRWPNYVVVEPMGQVKWSKEVAPPTLVSPVASAFDFDGDGAVEAVVADIAGLHVLSGRDGAFVGDAAAGSCIQAHGYPLVADLDGDGKAEIVVGSVPCSGSTAVGIHVFGESHDGWAGASSLEPVRGCRPGRQQLARQRLAAGSSAFAAADLSASFVRRSESGGDIVLTARIGNAGVRSAPAGLPVTVYNGNPRLGARFRHRGPDVARSLARGVRGRGLRLPSTREAQGSVFVVADDAGDRSSTMSECDEDNNFHDSGLFLNQPPKVDAGPDQDDFVADGYSGRRRFRRRLAARSRSPPLGILRGTARPDQPSAALRESSALDDHGDVPGARRLSPRHRGRRLRARESRFPEVMVYAANQAPVVNAGPDQVGAGRRPSCFGDGPGRRPAGKRCDHHGVALVLQPGLVTFGNPSSPATTAQFDTTGTYVLRLRASDGALSGRRGDGHGAAVNQAPVVNAGADQRW